jgi:hypothetical protein
LQVNHLLAAPGTIPIAPAVIFAVFSTLSTRSGEIQLKNKSGLIALLLLALVALSLAPVIHAESGYYRWTDKYGNPQHSDRPPPAGTNYEFIPTGGGFKQTRRGVSQEGSAPANTTAAPGQTPASQPGAAPPVLVKNAEFCEQARVNLEALSTNARVRLRSEDGEYRILSAEEKEAQAQKARDMIEVHCE